MTTHITLAPQPGPDPDALITSATATALAGGISQMTLWRWTRDGIIPPPTLIRGRKYWRRVSFLAALAVASPTDDPAPMPMPTRRAARPPKARPLSLPAAVAILDPD